MVRLRALVVIASVSLRAAAGEPAEAEPPRHDDEPHRVVEAIVRLKLPDRKERLRALETIKRFPDKAIPYLLKAARNDDALFRARVANALGLVGKGERDALWALAVLLKDPDTMVRREAIAALARAGDASHVKQIEPLLADREATVRADAVRAVAELEPPKAIERLKGFLQHADARVRRTALEELVRRQAPDLSALLPPLLKDADGGVRGDAVAALASVAPKDATAQLVELLGDAEPYVRSTTLAALKRLGARETVPRILGLLQDPSEDVRAEAISALGVLGGQEAVTPLLGQLAAPSKQLRERAALSLGFLRDKARPAVPGLIQLLSDGDEGVREKADLGLRLILRTTVGFQAGASLEHRQEAIAKWQEAWTKARNMKGK